MNEPSGVWPHPSGVGIFVCPPCGPLVRVLRSDVRKGVDDEPKVILQGSFDRPRRFLDLDPPLDREVTYTFETFDALTGEWSVAGTFAGKLEPALSYSAVEDADAVDTVSPRDALILFYSTRLAQLVRSGVLYVRGAREGESNHLNRYPVSPGYTFQNPDLPLITAEHAGSDGKLGDIGGTYTEEDAQIEFMAVSATMEERDSLASAIRGLLKDTDWFLEDAGMMLPQFGHFETGVEPVEPPLYTLRWSVFGRVTTWHSERDLPWELLPLTGWA